MESFVERWFSDGDGPALEVWHVAERATFEVRTGGEVLFSSARFVEILRFCMHDEVPSEAIDGELSRFAGPEGAEAIELSPWEPKD